MSYIFLVKNENEIYQIEQVLSLSLYLSLSLSLCGYFISINACVGLT